MTDSYRVAWAFKNLNDSGSALTLILRYETTINRSYNNAFKAIAATPSQPSRGFVPQSKRPRPTGSSPMPQRGATEEDR